MYQRVVVTVKRKDEARVRDLEVPVNIDASRLAEMIARALRWESDMAGQRILYVIEAHPLGRILQPDETLASAGVWDGSWLVLHPIQPPSAQQAETAPQAPIIQSAPQPQVQQPAQAAPAAAGVEQQPAAETVPAPAAGEAWTFPVVQTPAPAAPEFAPEAPPPANDSLLEMLLTGEQAAPTPTAETVQQPSAPEAQAAAQTFTQPESWTAPTPAAPEPKPVQAAMPVTMPEPELAPLPAQPKPVQAAENWGFPGAETPAFAQPSTPVQPEHEAAPEPAAWSFQADEVPLAAPAQAQPEPAPEPGSSSLLEMLLGGTPVPAAADEPEQTTQQAYTPAEAPAQQEPPYTAAWTTPAAQVPSPVEAEPEPQPVEPQADEWNFPVAEPHHLEAALQAQEEAEAREQPAPAWTFPVTPVTPQPEPEPAAAAPEQIDNSLLEMLLGGAPSPAASPQAPEPQAEAAPAQPETPEPYRAPIQPEPAAAAKVAPVPEPSKEQPAAAPAAAAAATADQQVAKPDVKPAAAQPKVGFRSLGIELPPEAEPPSEEKKTRFVWKKLDD